MLDAFARTGEAGGVQWARLAAFGCRAKSHLV